ncbi:hypothetical protein Ciccas_010296 [Cichlidogyrus casuarinus]|uniref:Uncharacterized protein n=1 Tax=Cichlidogyrus casuarinus TaxID=1844966 RepID=A0ABD2PUH6_9PLAT
MEIAQLSSNTARIVERWCERETNERHGIATRCKARLIPTSSYFTHVFEHTTFELRVIDTNPETGFRYISQSSIKYEKCVDKAGEF